jgi:hypothetical protein
MLIRLALAGAALLSIGAGSSEPATVVHDPVWFRGARLAPGLFVTTNFAGRCMAPSRSTSRGYAWRCSAEEQLFAVQHFLDPCFSATPHSVTVICPLDPWSKTVRLVSLTRRLPQWVERRERRNAPWGIWTINGKRCVLAVSGATLTLAGQRVRYECAGSGFLVGYVDVRGRKWTIGYVPRFDLGNPHLHPRPVGITDVWW